ncbi:beta strand repeat-containing protein [Patescibacteria group bacterium]
MHNVLRMGRRVFTVSVVVTTVAWAIGLSALLMPLAASAASLSSGDLIRASLPAVYYYGADGKRYVFPNKKTYDTWYSDFSGVKTITDAELAAITIGGNATYKPGVRMVKITTDPKVYAVAANGSLRWVKSETVATELYGSAWNTMIDDVPDAFFTNYTIGADVAASGDYDKSAVTTAASSINVDKGLSDDVVTGGGTLTIAANAMSPAAASMVSDSSTGSTDTDSGQQRVPMLKVDFNAGSTDLSLTSLKFRRGGISKDGDVDNLYLMDGDVILREATSVNDGVGTFNLASEPIVLSANSVKTLDLVMDLSKAASSGSTMNWSLASADVTSDASSVSGSVAGNSMTIATVEDLGQLELGQTNTYPSTVDPGESGKELWRVSFNALSQDVLITRVEMTNLGSANDADIQNLKLMDGATQLNGTLSQVQDKKVVFDLTTMADGGHKIKAGVNRQITLVGDVVGGTNRTFQWSVQKQYDIRVKDLEYNVWTFVDEHDETKDNAFAVVKAAEATTISTGNLSIGVTTDSPATNVPDGGTGITLAKFNFKATGEDVKVTAATVICQSSVAANTLLNTHILLDGVQVGTTDSTMTCGSQTDVANYTFGNSFILNQGQTHVVSIVADLTGDLSADDTLYVGFGGTAPTAQGRTSLETVTATTINGRTVTAKAGTLTVIKNLGFGNRSSDFPTGVSNAQDVKVGSFVVIAGAGEAVDVSQFVLLNGSTAGQSMGDNFQNLILKDGDGNQIGTTIASLSTTDSTGSFTFTPSTAIRVENGAQKTFVLYADVQGSPDTTATDLNGIEVDTVAATGVTTGASADFGTSGNDTTDVALQTNYISIEGNLTIDEAADTPVAQQLTLGSTGVSLAKFKLSADAAEDILVTQFIVADDMSGGQGADTASIAVRNATGTIRNLKLYNGSTLLSSVSALDSTNNSITPLATFTGFTLTVPRSENVVLEVKGDLSGYNDGATVSSTHRLIVPARPYGAVTAVGTNANDSALGTNSVTAVGAGSGNRISGIQLDIIGGSLSAGTTDADVRGSHMDMVRAKLTLAHASDSPSGSQIPASQQTVAKFVATNSANAGNYSVYIRNMNFDIASVGLSLPGSALNLKVYKDSVSSANELASTSYVGSWAATENEFTDTQIAAGDFTDLEISAGSSRTVIVTLDTSGVAASANNTLGVGLAAGANSYGFASAQWDDGVNHGGSDLDYYSVDTLPLSAKTIVY